MCPNNENIEKYSGRYKEAGCTIEARSVVLRKSDVLLSINPPKDEFAQMRGKVPRAIPAATGGRRVSEFSMTFHGVRTWFNVLIVRGISGCSVKTVCTAPVGSSRRYFSACVSSFRTVGRASRRRQVVISWVSRMFPTSKALLDDATRSGVTLIDVTAVRAGPPCNRARAVPGSKLRAGID